MRFLCLLALLSAGQCLADDSAWCSLTVRFVYHGIAPQPQRIVDTVGDAYCGDLSLVEESLIVNPINNGIRNVVVYAYEGRGGRKLPAVYHKAASEVKEVELANVNCNYVPRIVVMKTGDGLSIVNTDVIGYSTMLGFLANEAENFSLPAKSRALLQVKHPEPAPIPIECAIYPWMKARLLVLDHRYAGVSDQNGRLTIENLPTGTTLAFRIYHERANFPGIAIGEGKVTERGVFECQLTTGVNDLGTIDITPDRFGL